MVDDTISPEQVVEIEYSISTPEGHAQRYSIKLDNHSARLLNQPPPHPPAWTRLEVCQCTNCPLDAATHPHCPLAVQVSQVVDDWATVFSFQNVDYSVTTSERQFSGTTEVKKILGSLLGLIMATSDCPRMLFLRPLARFHLPLASPEETAFRALSAYLLEQYFIASDKATTATFDGFIKRYTEIQTVNEGLAARMQKASQEDAVIAAVLGLDLLAHRVPFFARETVETLRPLFAFPTGDNT
ncbi:MAG: hypothetical protein WBQ78_09865 [Gammaproteobacteria bacterium]